MVDHAPLADLPPAGFRTLDLDADDVRTTARSSPCRPHRLTAGRSAQLAQRHPQERRGPPDEDERDAIASYATTPDGNPPDVYNRLNLYRLLEPRPAGPYRARHPAYADSPLASAAHYVAAPHRHHRQPGHPLSRLLLVEGEAGCSKTCLLASAIAEELGVGAPR